MYKSIILLLFFVGFNVVKAQSIKELRSVYIQALMDHEKAEQALEKFKSVEEPTANMLAYQGALEAIMTRTTKNVFKKLGHLNDSEASFERAVELAPNDLEVRFMRLAVEHEIPRFLCMSEHIEEDIAFIVKNLGEFNPEYLPLAVRMQIVDFAKRSGYFSNNQIAVFKMVMAHNTK